MNFISILTLSVIVIMMKNTNYTVRNKYAQRSQCAYISNFWHI